MLDHRAVHHRPPQRKLILCKMTVHHLNPGKLFVSFNFLNTNAHNFDSKLFCDWLNELIGHFKQYYSRYDNHSPQSTTARNGGSDNQDERNGSTKGGDDDIKTENENDVSESNQIDVWRDWCFLIWINEYFRLVLKIYESNWKPIIRRNHQHQIQHRRHQHHWPVTWKQTRTAYQPVWRLLHRPICSTYGMRQN